MSRSVPIHREKHSELDVANCWACKAASISFGTVPGGTRDERTGISRLRQQEKDLHRYREKRRAGEQPDGTTKKAMDRSERKQDLWVRREQDVVDYNTPEAAKKVKRSLVNKV
jgi:hypothetical protein